MHPRPLLAPLLIALAACSAAPPPPVPPPAQERAAPPPAASAEEEPPRRAAEDPFEQCIPRKSLHAAMACAPEPATNPPPAIAPAKAPAIVRMKPPSMKRKHPHGGYPPRSPTPPEERSLAAVEAYLCYAERDAHASIPPIRGPGGRKLDRRGSLLEARYARASLHLQANRFEDAAVQLRALALDEPGLPDAGDVRVFAAHLYLDTLNVIGSIQEPIRPVCYDVMANDVPRLTAVFCADEHTWTPAGRDLCGVLARIQRDIDRLKAEDRVR